MNAKDFSKAFFDSHKAILWKLSSSKYGERVDPAQLATWWEQREAPRLLWRNRQLVDRRKDLSFSRKGFLDFLAGNIHRGLAVAQFIRENPAPDLSEAALLSEP
jgi:hypothetical protein